VGWDSDFTGQRKKRAMGKVMEEERKRQKVKKDEEKDIKLFTDERCKGKKEERVHDK